MEYTIHFTKISVHAGRRGNAATTCTCVVITNSLHHLFRTRLSAAKWKKPRSLGDSRQVFDGEAGQQIYQNLDSENQKRASEYNLDRSVFGRRIVEISGCFEKSLDRRIWPYSVAINFLFGAC
jgi:hypothetical protein